MECGPRKQSLDLTLSPVPELTKAGRLGEALSALRVVDARKVTVRTSFLWLKTWIPVKIINVLSRQTYSSMSRLTRIEVRKVGTLLGACLSSGSRCTPGPRAAEGTEEADGSQMSTETCHFLAVHPQGPPLVP